MINFEDLLHLVIKKHSMVKIPDHYHKILPDGRTVEVYDGYSIIIYIHDIAIRFSETRAQYYAKVADCGYHPMDKQAIIEHLKEIQLKREIARLIDGNLKRHSKSDY